LFSEAFSALFSEVCFACSLGLESFLIDFAIENTFFEKR
jgi:hypothetical protein